jgi:SET domain-containing protein
MLLVRTVLRPSPIHGIGLFADEFIPRGTVIWRLHRAVDLVLDERTIETLAPPARDQVLKYSYVDVFLRQRVLCGDDARFFNHDDRPNCTDLPDADGGKTVAARDILPREELTCDYSTFDLESARHR